MTTYTDVFGTNTVPSAGFPYNSYSLTTNTTFLWPYNASGEVNLIAKVMDVTCNAGVAITLPDATQVSTGEDFLIRNRGGNALLIKDSAGSTVTTVVPGAAVYFYLTDNSTAAGTFGVIAYGVGSSTVDAAALVGYGIKAVGESLNQSHPVTESASTMTIDTSHRAKLVVLTGGNSTVNLPDVTSVGDDFFVLIRNGGTGTTTIEGNGSQLVDGQLNLEVQPGESLMLVCSGSTWYSVGYGRSVLYQFTQLTKDVSAGGTITLTASEAGNKLLTFVGNPAADLTVLIPSVVSIYYVNNAISTNRSILIKTLGGTGASVGQNQRVILLNDGTNVVSAQSTTTTTSISLVNGSATLPSLNFASQTNTGLYKEGSTGMGISVNGVNRMTFSETLTSFADATNLKVPVLLRNGSSTTNVSLIKE